MSFPQILKLTEGLGSLKFEKGTLCHNVCSHNICVQASDFVNTAWRGDISDYRYFRWQIKLFIITNIPFYVGENVYTFGICYILKEFNMQIRHLENDI